MLTLELTSNGITTDISESILSLHHESQMNGGASKIRFQVLKGDKISFFEGDHVRVLYQGKAFFVGRIFTKSRSDFYVVEVLAYDSLRYLKNRDTCIFRGKTAGQILSEIVEGQGLQLGAVAQTEHLIESLVAENRSYLDMIYDALRRTLIARSQLYTLQDRVGKICLAQTEALHSGVRIEAEQLSGLSYSSSIDDVTANTVQVVQDGEDATQKRVILRTDPKNQQKWGKLSHFYQGDPEDSLGVLNTKADQILQAYNKISRRLEVETIGHLACLAGHVVHVTLPLESLVDQPFIIDRAVHRFEKGGHFMRLSLLTNHFEGGSV